MQEAKLITKLMQENASRKDLIIELRSVKGWKIRPLAAHLNLPYHNMRQLLEAWNVQPPAKRFANPQLYNGVYVNLDKEKHKLLKQAAEQGNTTISHLAYTVLDLYLKETLERLGL